ncbi:MAG: hypothetical protein HY791_04660 [Deltaproteobacteria bacterium]|nr:hypothetical protein [Deltaproteobacteria bacterium]
MWIVRDSGLGGDAGEVGRGDFVGEAVPAREVRVRCDRRKAAQVEGDYPVGESDDQGRDEVGAFVVGEDVELDRPLEQGSQPVTDPPLVEAASEKRKSELAKWSITETESKDLSDRSHIRILTPGSDAGEPIHLLSALERRSKLRDDNLDGARDTLSAAVSLLLRLVGRDPEPGQSREHTLLSVLAERRLRDGSPAARTDDEPGNSPSQVSDRARQTVNRRLWLSTKLMIPLSPPSFTGTDTIRCNSVCVG